MRKLMALAIAASGLVAVSPALAATFDVVTGYDTAPYTYGFGTGGTNFALFSTNGPGCFGQPNFTCHRNGGIPAIGKNVGPNTINFQSVTLPNDVVYMAPGDSDVEDAILRFTAAAADTYTLNGNFIRLDSTPTDGLGQDGVRASIFKVSGATYTSLYSNVLVGTLNSSIGFSGLTTTLAAGDRIDFVINRRTAFNSDNTGLRATITTNVPGAVPEPATWAMMLLGFGAVGSAMRRRSKVSVRFA